MTKAYSALFNAWEREREREREEGGTMNSSSSGSAPKHVETVSLLQRSFSCRISSNKVAISGGAPTCNKNHKEHSFLSVLAVLISWPTD